ncbi:MAG: GH92 family glycosyl hydrolase [Bacteroidales bacterium]
MNRFLTIAMLYISIISTSCSENPKKENFLQYVNPFVGAASNGHCNPGACVPFGLIQAGPQSGNCSWAYCAGYQYKDTIIQGFSQTRLSGTGCPDLGDLLLFPFKGNSKRSIYASGYDKKIQAASPGYYRVLLKDEGILAEITATAHTALHRYTYQGKEDPQLLIDFQNGMVFDSASLYLHKLDTRQEFEGQTRITGYAHTQVWLERKYYFVIEFSKPYAEREELPKRSEREAGPRYVFSFDLEPGEELLVKIAISSESVEGAKNNLETELAHWNFDEVKASAESQWEELLSRIRVEGTTEQKNIFYTSMYHLFIQPNNIADAGKPAFYSTLSLWDTYRAAHPLYTILTPEKVDDFVNSMLHQNDITGHLPIWTLWGGETYCMIANHGVPPIVDAYLKGFKGFDAERAYKAVKKSLTENHRNSDWALYDEYGYYPFDLQPVESVSRTLESTYDDYCAAQFAKALGKEADYIFFMKRAGYYKNLFDPSTKLMRAKDSKGQWRTPFSPLSLSHAGSSGGDYTEGNAWQYTWHVQHDVQGLISLLGGPVQFCTKLDTLFTLESSVEGTGFVADVTGLIGQYAHGNEPSHHVAYLYALAGKPERTAELIHKICKTQYQDKVDGLCGNDDCGQMSAWYIFSCLGFYPVNPCGGEYVLGAPQLPEATISLDNGKTFNIKTKNFAPENMFVQSIELNGLKYEKPFISHQDILHGGSLTFVMGPQRP